LNSFSLLLVFTGIIWGEIAILELNYADDLGILDKSVKRKNEILDVLRIQGARIGLKINFTK
jgi:hypothetical protein